MLIQADLSEVKKAEWQQFAIRFALGGAITVTAGMVAEKFGAEIGGLFLAFPAIFPASVTLVEKNEKRKKSEKGLQGDNRGRAAARLDAYGAALGSMALMAFAAFDWILIARYASWLVLTAATCVWAACAFAAWVGFRWWRHRRAGYIAARRKNAIETTRFH